MSEPFLDPRLLDMARAARNLGMRPYEHTNGDVLRRKPELCREAAEVFEWIVIGIYEPLEGAELEREQAFWMERLAGTQLRFSMGSYVFPRSETPYDARMFREKSTYPKGPCFRPLQRLIVHYDGNVALCCEDMKDEFGLANAFELPIEEIWNSERHLSIVKNLQKGRRELYPLCSQCPMPPPESSHPLKRLWERLRS